MKSRMYNIRKVVEVTGFFVALADDVLFVKGYGDQWIPIPLPFDCDDYPKHISGGEKYLILVTACDHVYKLYGMYLADVAYKNVVDSTWPSRHWARISVGIRQVEA